MFANLKNKIFEEVKASPQKLQQFAQAAQAAVSSASSNTSESASGTDNFFSITEEDTPQNSPQKRLTIKNSSDGMLPNLPLNNGPTGTRVRRLSNSSAASDVSFRLPTYDSPAVYHLQSDLDISASEVEDSVGPTFPKLEHISKEHLYDAYKRALTRYQKYRLRYTDLAKKYKDLERDNGKARQVLVETQDKAIRRISELKEQCSLEQQAKSHLEEALRMEMDDMQCKIKAYQTKLKLLGENSEVVDIQNNVKSNEDNLINLDAETNEQFNKASETDLQELQNSRVEELENQLSESSNRVGELRGKLNEYEAIIENLKKREEENQILLAQNKLMIHSELENKESEVKMLKSKLVDLENRLQQSQQTESILKNKIAEVDELQKNLKMITNSKQDLEAKIISSEHIVGELKRELKEKEDQLQSEKAVSDEKIKTFIADYDTKINDLQRQNDELNEMLRQSNKSEIELAEIDNELNRVKMENVALRTSADHLRNEKEMMVVDMNGLKTQLENKEKLLRECQEREAALLKSEYFLKEELELMKSKAINCTEWELEQLMTAQQPKSSISDSCLNILKRNLSTIVKYLDKALYENQGNKVERSKLENLKLHLDYILEEIDNMNRLHSEKNKGHISRLESLLTEVEAKLKLVENENLQFAKKNRLIEDTYNTLTIKLQENDENYKREIDILNGIIRESEAKYNNLYNEYETTKNTIQKLNEMLSQVQEENSQLYNAKEIIEKEVRALKHQLEKKEKEHVFTSNCKENLEAEVQILKEEVTSLRRESSNLNEISNNMRGDLDVLNSELNEEKAMRKKINTDYENVVKIKDSLEADLKELQLKFQAVEKEHEKRAVLLTNEIEELEVSNKLMKEEHEALETELKLSKQSLQEYKEGLLKETSHEHRAIKHQGQEVNEEKQCLKEPIRNATDLEKKLQNYDEVNIENEYLKTLSNQLQSEVENLKTDNVKYSDEIKLLMNEISMLNEQKIKHQEDNELLSKELKIAKSTINSLSDALKVEQGKTKRAIEQNTNTNCHNDFTQKELLLVQTKLAEAEKLCGETRKSYEHISNENEYLKGQVSLLSEQTLMLTKEIESNKYIINNVSEELEHSQKRLELLEGVENENRQLQNTLEDLEAQISQKNRIQEEQLSQKKDSDNLREVNEDLQRELEDLKEKTSMQILDLNKKLQEASNSARSLTEKLQNYEHLEEECSRLTDDLNAIRKTASSQNSSSDLDLIRQEKKDLENKLNKIMHEVQDVSNRNLFLEQKCENYLILEQSNVRLKLANEKLSRQLDETLVSMQHNEGIQANTEFEYLRNIMFQYLTGTVNENSGTLVKVIAAVLKFTPQQTQIVLQKEQQRHTLLGQINQIL